MYSICVYDLSGVLIMPTSNRRKEIADIGAAASYKDLLDHLKQEQELQHTNQVPIHMSVEMHTDIRVLEARFENLDRSVGAVNAKLDQLVSTQEQFIRLQEQHEQTRASLDRAMLVINTMSALTTDTESKLTRALYFVRGGAAVGALLFAVIQWYVLEQIRAIEQVGEHADLMEHRITVIEEAHKPRPVELHSTWPDAEVPAE